MDRRNSPIAAEAGAGAGALAVTAAEKVRETFRKPFCTFLAVNTGTSVFAVPRSFTRPRSTVALPMSSS